MIIYTEKTALTRQINVRTKPDGRKYRDDEVEADNINATDILRIGLEICGLFRKFGLLVHKFSLVRVYLGLFQWFLSALLLLFQINSNRLYIFIAPNLLRDALFFQPSLLICCLASPHLRGKVVINEHLS